jgi:hypothetical protein
VLLPFVASLPWIDGDVLAKVFGQTMAIRNALPDAAAMPNVPPLSGYEEIMQHRKSRRAYWREKQRESRANRKKQLGF